MDTNEMVVRFARALMFRRRRASWLVPAGIGVGVGVVIGLGCGVMLAPHTGRETRRALLNGATRAAESARELATRAKTRAGRLTSNAADKALAASDIAEEYTAR